MGEGLLRSELARRTGCHLETIRYYEKIGLMPEPPRNASGYRIYAEDHVSRLNFIQRARMLGFNIEEIRGLTALVADGTPTCADIKERTERHLTDVRARIADLKRIEAVLATTVAQCTGEDRPECPVLDTLSERIL